MLDFLLLFYLSYKYIHISIFCIIRQRTKLKNIDNLLSRLVLLGVLLRLVELLDAAANTFNQMTVGKCITSSHGIMMLG